MKELHMVVIQEIIIQDLEFAEMQNKKRYIVKGVNV